MLRKGHFNPREALKSQGGVRRGIWEQERGSPFSGKNLWRRQQDAKKKRLPGVSGTARQGYCGLTECDRVIPVPLEAQEVVE